MCPITAPIHLTASLWSGFCFPLQPILIRNRPTGSGNFLRRPSSPPGVADHRSRPKFKQIRKSRHLEPNHRTAKNPAVRRIGKFSVAQKNLRPSPVPSSAPSVACAGLGRSFAVFVRADLSVESDKKDFDVNGLLLFPRCRGL